MLTCVNVELTTEQKIAFEKIQRQSSDRHVRDRVRCVLLSSEGWSTAMIAQSQHIHETTVRRHLNDWLNEQKLVPENGGSQSHLSEEQTKKLRVHLTRNLLPATVSIIELVDEWWGIRYTIPGMNKWLHRNGLSYRKPAGVPHKYSAEAQQAFVEIYEKLKQEAGDDDPILFIDGVHPTQGTKLAYGWMPAGKKNHVVETTGSRPRLNIMGALNLNDISRTVIWEYDKINSHNIALFFIDVRETYPIKQKVHIILDGAEYHRTEQVKTWAYLLNIERHYLPPYKTNLNPIERLWKVMNEQGRNNSYFNSPKVLREEIHRFFSVKLPAVAETLVGRINDNFQLMKNAASS
ncbi:Transposase and inactivated derivatives [Citrobacter amalonaticus]|nr:Transposase and inactivated derivatives [Citrobacter amalonaticus]